jgi:DNA-binding transcriptional regulator YdaS (Cro superfamily)
MRRMDLSEYLKAERGRTGELAAMLSVSGSLVTQWASGKAVSAERCPEIERATAGAVTRRDLRPDDWWLIWPELVTAEHPAPVAKAA